MTISMQVEFEREGEFRIRERLDKHEDGYFPGASLIEIETPLNATVRSIPGEALAGELCTIEISGYHQTNPETGRTFHGNLSVCLTRSDVLALRDFLTVLVQHGEERSEE